MSKKPLHSRGVTLAIIVLFILASFTPIIGGYSEEINKRDTYVNNDNGLQEDVSVTCYTFGFPGELTKEISMPLNEAQFLLNKIEELQREIARDPRSDKTQQLQNEIIEIASNYNLLPDGLSPQTIKSRLHPIWIPQSHRKGIPSPLQNRASEWFCNFASTGSGSALPIIVLPRLIPILLTPIPRIFVKWSAITGATSCGGLVSRTGFIASGQQKGFALGFWGLGLSVFLPPLMAYGLIGYALYASVEAEEIEYWPPNYAPLVEAVYPPDGVENVPISTTELKFSLDDFNEDLMSYTVTTDPDIGSGSEIDVPNGIYTVPISGLEGTEEYTWHVVVSDGEDQTEETFIFTTEPVAPIVYDPVPPEGARNTPIELSELRFSLTDPQGGLMDYTVETSPDIGSGSASGVGDGTYTVDISGVDYDIEYTWYVNVTDGEHWKHKVYSFKTRPVPAPWWNDDWAYRKEIIVNYAKIVEDLSNFPVLINLDSDANLAMHTQDDGDDIVFTDYSGVKLNHEIELFNDDNGRLIAWVNMPDLNPDSILYMYYGNPTCSNQQNMEGAWGSNYVGVWHMDDYTAEQTNDSKNNNHGLKNTVQSDGIIGYGQRFDSSQRNQVDCGNDPSLYGLCGTNDFTLECWVKTSMSGSGRFFNKDDWDPGDNDKRGWYWSIRNTYHKAGGYASANDAGSGAWQEYNWGTTINDGMWHYLALKITWEGSTGTAYYIKDANSPIPDAMGINQINPFVDNLDLGIGSNEYAEEHGQPASLFGDMNECRISKIARSDAWLLTSYNTQSDPSSFLSFGPEEP